MTKKMLGLVLAVLGLAAVAGAALFIGWEATRPSPDCPALRPAASTTQAYLTDAEIRLGGRLCLAFNRSSVFAPEQAALNNADRDVAAAQAALNAAGATPAAAAAQSQLNQAKAVLAALPHEREMFVFFDEVQVPIAGRAVAVRPPADAGPWALERFPLVATEDATGNAGRDWRMILGGPKSGGVRAVRIGIAVRVADGQPPVIREVIRQPATLRVFNPFWLMAGGAGLILLAVGIVLWGWDTGLLRDGDKTSQFSLGRVQMALWLVLTVGGFLFIWLVSAQWKGVVTGGVIALLGISATTGVAAKLVDTTPAAPSNGFWADIMSDSDGAALHRIQLIAWTIVLAGIFVWTVSWQFGFPEFDTNLLLLAGIAGGTYLGFKFQESDTGSPPNS